ncbi:hypothetical protein CPB85DRAFT_993002 [Mucidula mucida]|nr:hypothetical protein CPB85DRAFT_993002 [Mucidula mucida]
MSGKLGSTATETAPPTSRQTLFTFNPPPLQRNDSVPPPIPSAPLHFLDRHIPECLILKRVKSSISTSDCILLLKLTRSDSTHYGLRISSFTLLCPTTK